MRSVDTSRIETNDNALITETDIKDMKELELSLRNCKHLSDVVHTILQDILFFEANKHLHVTYDCKSVKPETKVARSVEIKFSVSGSSIKGESVIVAVFRDTTGRDMMAALEHDHKFKNDMLATISHELRTPLNGNINFVESALASNEISESTKSEFLTPALNCSYLLKWVISDILDLALINAKTIKPNITMENLQNTVNNCIQLVAKKINQKGLAIVTHLPQAPLLFCTDHSRLFQILLNLLNNAIKFSERGTITINVTSESNTITLSVSDEGIGLKAENKAQLQSYLKENTMQKKLNQDSAGAGFGLFISNFHAKMLGASEDSERGIHLTSTEGEGSNFWFTIEDKGKKRSLQPQAVFSHGHLINIEKPHTTRRTNTTSASNRTKVINNYISSITLEDDDPDEDIAEELHNDMHFHITRPSKVTSFAQPLNSPSARCLCPKTLIVDDDPFNILSLQKMLASLGIDCNTAYHGKEAVQKFTQRRLQTCGKKCRHYQLILMDCNMPIMNGFDACKEIRKLINEEEAPQIKIIGCTAYVTEHASSESSSCGMDMLINKPLSRTTLKDLITRYAISI
jgi:signal transduction histidine kinase/CheY-like chemotaxis protein